MWISIVEMPNELTFEMPDVVAFDYAWYENQDRFNFLCKQIMNRDLPCNGPALDYMRSVGLVGFK